MSLLTPRAIIVGTERDVDGLDVIELKDRPFVSLVSDRLLRDPFTEDLLRYHGYRRVEYRMMKRTWLIARPLPLVLALRLGVWIRGRYWQTLRWLYDRGVFHLASRGIEFRWRDLRPGRGAEVCRADEKREGA